MTSLRPLALNACYLSKEEVQTAIFGSAINQNRETKTTRSDKTTLRVRCANNVKECTFRCNAKAWTKGENVGKWRITKLNENHSCTQGQSGRKRQYNSKVIQNCIVSEKTFAPFTMTSTETCQARQLQDTVKENSNLVLKYGQAHKIIQSRLADKLKAEHENFRYLESLLNRMKDTDPDGKYELVTSCDADGKRRFVRLYVAFGGNISFSRKLRKIIYFDTCHVGTEIGGVLIFGVAKDANNHPVLLNFSYIAQENEATWAWHKTLTTRDFHDTMQTEFIENKDYIFINPGEQTISAVREAVEAKVTDMVYLFMRHNMNMFAKNKADADKAAAKGLEVTPVTLRMTLKDYQLATTEYEVTISEISSISVEAHVIVSRHQYITYDVILTQDDTTGNIDCCCMENTLSGRPCKPALAVLAAISSSRYHEVKGFWSYHHKKWYHSNWHVTTWQEQYREARMQPYSDLKGLQETELLPWKRQPKKPGRPAKARKRARGPGPERKN